MKGAKLENTGMSFVRSHIPNSVSLDKSNNFLNLFCVYFWTCHSVLKIESFGAFEYGLKSPNATFILFVTVSPYHQRFTPNNGSMNRLLSIRSSWFLRWVSVRTVVFEHSTGEQVSLYRPNCEIYAQENIFVVSFHHFSNLVSKLNKGIKQSFWKNSKKGRNVFTFIF